MKLATFLLVLILSCNLLAKDQLLIISGGVNPKEDETRYQYIAEYAYNTMKERPDLEISIAANDGSWDFASEVTSPAQQLRDIENQLKKIQKRLGPTDSVTIFITDHGDAPATESLGPLSGGFFLYSPNEGQKTPAVSHQKLLDMINRILPASTTVKLVGIHCFAGGLQHLAFERPNTCAATGVDFNHTMKSRQDYNLYGRSFWQEVSRAKYDLDANKQCSLYEAHLAGFSSDYLNYNSAQISSMAYLDYILEENVYQKKSTEEKDDFLSSIFSFHSPRIPKLSCDYCYVGQNSDIESFDLLAQNAQEIALDAIFSPNSQFEQIQNLLPVSIAQEYQRALALWKNSKGFYLPQLQRYHSLREQKINDWKKLKETAEYQNADNHQKSQMYQDHQEYLRRLDTDYFRDFTPFIAAYKTMKNADKIVRFHQQYYNKPQWRKFEELLRCETEDL